MGGTISTLRLLHKYLLEYGSAADGEMLKYLDI
jgi:hypothetical protein